MDADSFFHGEANADLLRDRPGAGKWKTSTVDAYGNVFVVTEPNPAGGIFTTSYTYTPANQLTGVSIAVANAVTISIAGCRRYPDIMGCGRRFEALARMWRQ